MAASLAVFERQRPTIPTTPAVRENETEEQKKHVERDNSACIFHSEALNCKVYCGKRRKPNNQKPKSQARTGRGGEGGKKHTVQKKHITKQSAKQSDNRNALAEHRKSNKVRVKTKIKELAGIGGLVSAALVCEVCVGVGDNVGECGVCARHRKHGKRTQ